MMWGGQSWQPPAFSRRPELLHSGVGQTIGSCRLSSGRQTTKDDGVCHQILSKKIYKLKTPAESRRQPGLAAPQ
jgi:hypothetical protein